MPADAWHCPPHRVRISKRARRILLKLSMDGSLEVVLPSGHGHIDVASLLFRRRAWLEQARARLQRRSPEVADPALPTQVSLSAIDANWNVRHVTDMRPGWRLVGEDTVEIGGTADEAREALRLWLLQQGREHLSPWLQALGKELGLGYRGLGIRTQRSRWGSCSARGRINLNATLLFLPPAWVRHVLVHELCHRRHLNHSAAFWALVARHDPDYATTRAAMRDAWKHVPGWLTAAMRRK